MNFDNSENEIKNINFCFFFKKYFVDLLIFILKNKIDVSMFKCCSYLKKILECLNKVGNLMIKSLNNFPDYFGSLKIEISQMIEYNDKKIKNLSDKINEKKLLIKSKSYLIENKGLLTLKSIMKIEKKLMNYFNRIMDFFYYLKYKKIKNKKIFKRFNSLGLIFKLNIILFMFSTLKFGDRGSDLVSILKENIFIFLKNSNDFLIFFNFAIFNKNGI
jgi:hypothetical protein